MSEYYEKLAFVKAKVIFYLKNIFKVYGNELLLRLEEYNLLSNENNCIETSTATGFIMEEFITTKLEIYSKEHNDVNDIKIEKIKNKPTVNMSYDCFVNYQEVFFMINVKIQKEGSSNNAVAAINMLYKDYVVTNPDKEKSYMVLKTNYKFGASEKNGERKIIIQDVTGYCLEEIDFTCGHKQDHRNWSKEFKASSGRLQVTNSYRKNNLLLQNKILYETTKQFICNIFSKNN